MKKCYGAFDLGPWGQQNVSTKAGSNCVLFVEKLQMVVRILLGWGRFYEPAIRWMSVQYVHEECLKVGLILCD